MGMVVVLESERGVMMEQVIDESNVLGRLLPDDLESGVCLRFIDWYGDTVFNQLQIKPFRAEWQALLLKARTQEERDFLMAVDRLADHCEQQTHTYLRFLGD